MSNPRITFAVLLLTSLAGGCATPPASLEVMDHWVARQGGVGAGPTQQRAERAARVVAGDCSGHPITIHVLATDALAAFSWPSGDVYVTRGLVQALDDGELAAAVAHELGHLLSDGHLRSMVSLAGSAAPLDCEERADAFGVALLRSQHVPPAAMVSMLRKVRDGGTLSTSAREAIERRIHLLGEIASRG